MLPPRCAIRAGGINCATFFMALPRASRPVGFVSCDGYHKVINDIPAPAAYYLLSSQRMWHDLKPLDCLVVPWILRASQVHGWRCFDNTFGAATVVRCGMGTLLEKRKIRFAQAVNARVLAVMQQRREDKSQNYERKKSVFIAKISEMVSAQTFTIIMLY